MPDSGKACAQSMGLLFARRKAEQLMGVQKSVNDMKIGEQGTVVGLGCSGALRRRIIDMGITPGVKISVRKTAPFGDPCLICVRGYELSLRKKDMKQIQIEEVQKNEYRLNWKSKLRENNAF